MIGFVALAFATGTAAIGLCMAFIHLLNHVLDRATNRRA